MLQSSTAGLMALLTTYGYWAVFACIAIESTGIPFPGETMLLVAAIYAGTTHRFSLALVIATAESFAILGFWIGREGGYRLVHRYGRSVRPNERKLKLGLYLFRRHGGKVVFFGRFVAVLRMRAAFLAGVNRMGTKCSLLWRQWRLSTGLPELQRSPSSKRENKLPPLIVVPSSVRSRAM